jgi:hypothetical protein
MVLEINKNTEARFEKRTEEGRRKPSKILCTGSLTHGVKYGK